MSERGGVRQGRTGQAYSNRTDLHTGQAASAPTYGSGAELQRQEAGAPLADGGVEATGSAPLSSPALPPVEPGSLPDLHSPLTPGEASGEAAGGPNPAMPTDAEDMSAWLPYLKAAADDPTCPPTILNALRYWKAAVASAGVS